MPTVVVSTARVSDLTDVGGHFWVYLQYVKGLQLLGCDVYWLDRLPAEPGSGDPDRALATFDRRLAAFGLSGRAILYRPSLDADGAVEFFSRSSAGAEALLGRADLLLNFHYQMPASLLARFRRTALVDIDPGLLQFWISTGQLALAPHDRYFTTGETVGTPAARFPNCGLPWTRIRPVVCLPLWPVAPDEPAAAFTTVSSWWGDEWIADGDEVYENNKRVTFLEYATLPRHTRERLELALYFGAGDAEDLRLLAEAGWSVRHSRDVCGTPEQYHAYVQASRGEFSCAKPSCMKFQNAWISDRTLCYLASGRPAVVQDTGPSAILPRAEGLFRFSSLEEAAAALEAAGTDYARQRLAARALAERHFDVAQVGARMLDCALG